MLTRGMMTSTTAEWETPQDLFDKLNAMFHFDLDPCATAENAKCERYYTAEDNGLQLPWGGAGFLQSPVWARIAEVGAESLRGKREGGYCGDAHSCANRDQVLA